MYSEKKQISRCLQMRIRAEKISGANEDSHDLDCGDGQELIELYTLNKCGFFCVHYTSTKLLKATVYTHKDINAKILTTASESLEDLPPTSPTSSRCFS